MASDFLENRLVDGVLRGGALTTAGAAGSSTVVRGIWTASTTYAIGDIVVPHANMVAAGGKFLRCTTAGTSGSTNTLTVPAPGATLADNTVTWTAMSGIPSYTTIYVALFTTAPADSGGGTEVTGGSYARIAVACTLAAWAGTQSAGSTTASSGTSGVSSNNASITFATPTADWGTIVAFGIFDRLTSGNLLFSAPLSSPRVVLNGDAGPSFAAGQLTVTAG